MNRNASAVFADADVHAESTSFAVHYVISDFSLNAWDIIGFLVFSIKTAEYVLDSDFTPAHDLSPSGASNGLRIPRRVLLLT
jgi:hypothetical protein